MAVLLQQGHERAVGEQHDMDVYRVAREGVEETHEGEVGSASWAV